MFIRSTRKVKPEHLKCFATEVPKAQITQNVFCDFCVSVAIFYNFFEAPFRGERMREAFKAS
ncbi:hypothetical protein DU508_21935 [Pedobacter chinensis]|uniref:Uncharacterized protein n=1 Tax=Pedobacter chinensis TaxID=2282421 RepID=A0A369PP58_9SPHI|nr:hypothetical protein DU508_21935 [Pedobacter chinensis]